ncbi:hypothetical protein JYT84_00870, partial [bacterium AH-315-M10]|nr:hypothetical protein [bacterium AH-315-M10]
WTLTTPALTDGAHTITATATDAAGNISTLTGGLSVTIDTAAPAAPSTPDLNAASDSGSSNTDNNTSDNTPTFSGTAEAGATVEVFSDGVSQGTTTATGGVWTLTTPTLTDGAHSITATATDTAGNVSALSAGLSVTIDTAAPAAPSTPDLVAGSDSGSSDTDDLTSDSTPTFSGTAEAGATLELFSDGVSLGTTTATGGTWTLTSPTLAIGTHSITATATDTAGNVSALSSGLPVTIDIVAANPPPPPDLATESDTGISNSDNITGLDVITLRGSGREPFSPVHLTSSINGLVGTTTADALGNWAITTIRLRDGVHLFRAQVFDLAGNSLGVSEPLFLTVDTTDPHQFSLANFTPLSPLLYEGAQVSEADPVRELAPIPALLIGLQEDGLDIEQPLDLWGLFREGLPEITLETELGVWFSSDLFDEDGWMRGPGDNSTFNTAMGHYFHTTSIYS